MADPLVVDDSIVEVRFRYSLFGQELINVWHVYNNITAVGGVSLVTYGDQFAQLLKQPFGVAGVINAMQSSECNFHSIDFQQIKPERLAYYSVPGPGVGQQDGIEGLALPPNIAAVVTLRPDVAGKGKSGSMHVPGIPKDQAVNGKWTALTLSKMDALADAIIGQFAIAGGVTCNAVIYSRTPGVVAGTIFDHISQPQCRVQRRRTVGLGQ